MKKNLLIAAALLIGMAASAQSFVSIPLSKDTFKASHLTPLPKGNYQGMDIYKNYLLSCWHTGIATLYTFDGKTVTQVAHFPLDSHDEVNHSNVVSFGVERYAKKDPLPLVYISQCHKKPYKGNKDVLFVERVASDLQSSELVQMIRYDDVNNDFGYALQWVVDRQHKMLYGFGNTTKDKDVEGNRHRIIKFRLPRLADGKEVVLHPEDALENYVVEDHGLRYATIGQGLCIYKGKLMMPTGLGTDKYPSYLFIWDLRKKQPVEVLDMSIGTTGELEDLAHYKGNTFIVQGQDGLFLLSL